MKKRNLSVKFALYSLILILMTGVCTAYVIMREVRVQVLKDYEKSSMTARQTLYHHLKRSDFELGDERLASKAFSREMNQTGLIDHFAYIKIWRKDGTVIYSNAHEAIGEKVKVAGHLQDVLNGQTVVEEGGHIDKDHGDVMIAKLKDQEVLEIYTPIKFDGKVVGIFETYCLLSPIVEQTRNINTYVVSIVSGSMALLWLILSGVVRKASSKIEDQNISLNSLAKSRAKSLKDLEDNYLGTLKSLASAVEARCPYTSGHSARTGQLAGMLANKMGLSEEESMRIGPAAMLHDIGKIGTPEAILNKINPLTGKEWALMKKHPVVGASIVAAVPALKKLVPIIRGHHERYDGTGYPDGLIGQNIPVEARVLGVIDALDAMVCDRSYRKALSMEEAFAQLEKAKDSQFDPVVVDEFLELYRENEQQREKILCLYKKQPEDDQINANRSEVLDLFV